MKKERKADPIKQLFPDNSGVYWQRYNKRLGVTRPRYADAIPYSAKDLRGLILSDFEPQCVSMACLPLPFSSVPMWPHKAHHAKSAWSFACYYCPVCECEIVKTPPQIPWRVCIHFVIGQRRDGYYDFTWICRLLCGLCSPNDGNCSVYPNILHSRDDLNTVLKPILKDFDDRWSGSKCIVCERELKKRITKGIPVCNDKECIRSLPMINSMIGGGDYAESLINISPRARTKNMMDYLRKCRVDICTPMRWNVCHRNGCVHIGRTNITCDTCKRVMYCSEECRVASLQLHKQGCRSYLEVWDAEKLLFI